MSRKQERGSRKRETKRTSPCGVAVGTLLQRPLTESLPELFACKTGD